MDLRAALRRDEFGGLSDDESLKILTSDGDPILKTELQTVAAIVKAIGQDATRQVIGTIKAVATKDPLVDAFYYKLCGLGEDWSDPEWQANIDVLAVVGGWPKEVTTALHRMGIVPQAKWQNLGISVQPTLDDITVAREANTAEDALQAFSTLCQSVIGQWRDGLIASTEDAKKLIANG